MSTLKSRAMRVIVMLLAAAGLVVMQPSAPATASTNYTAGSCKPVAFGTGYSTAIFKVTHWKNSNGTHTFHYSIRGGYRVRDLLPDPRFYWYGMKTSYGYANYWQSEWYLTLGGVYRPAYHTGIWNSYVNGIFTGRAYCSVLLPIA